MLFKQLLFAWKQRQMDWNTPKRPVQLGQFSNLGIHFPVEFSVGGLFEILWDVLNWNPFSKRCFLMRLHLVVSTTFKGVLNRRLRNGWCLTVDCLLCSRVPIEPLIQTCMVPLSSQLIGIITDSPVLWNVLFNCATLPQKRVFARDLERLLLEPANVCFLDFSEKREPLFVLGISLL